MPASDLASRADPALPAAAEALDARTMLPLLAAVAGVHGDDIVGVACAVEVLSHKAGRRYTVRYALTGDGLPGGPVSLIGKLYRKRHLAARIQAWMQLLRVEALPASEADAVPRSFGVVDELGLGLQAEAAGDDIRHALAAGTADDPIRRSARWLAALHRADPVDGLKRKSREHELFKVDLSCEAVAPHLRGPDAHRLVETRARLHAAAGAMGAGPVAMIHRDFYYAHVLWNGERIGIIDFDSLSAGDPALDAAHFLAHLENIGYRQTGDFDRYAVEGTRFLQAYLDAGAHDVRPRIAFFRSYTWLKLAGLEAAERRGEWHARLVEYVRRAARTAEAA